MPSAWFTPSHALVNYSLDSQSWKLFGPIALDRQTGSGKKMFLSFVLQIFLNGLHAKTKITRELGLFMNNMAQQ